MTTSRCFQLFLRTRLSTYLLGMAHDSFCLQRYCVTKNKSNARNTVATSHIILLFALRLCTTRIAQLRNTGQPIKHAFVCRRFHRTKKLHAKRLSTKGYSCTRRGGIFESMVNCCNLSNKIMTTYIGFANAFIETAQVVETMLGVRETRWFVQVLRQGH